MAEALKSLVRRRQQRQEPPSPERGKSLLDLCPDHWKRTLKANHPNLRHEIRVKDVLPGFHSFLTDVEYMRVQGSDKADNVDQVDQLVGILLTKEKREFEEFLVALLQQRHASLAARLAEEAGGRTMSDDVCVHSALSAAIVPLHGIGCVQSLLCTSCTLPINEKQLEYSGVCI